MSEEKKTMSDRMNGLKSEFGKIIWPTPETIGKQTAATIIISVILAFLIAVIDMVVQYGVDFIMGL